ncbi:MAG: hypothetical protein JXR46_13495 [Calditrichaceae bacterium]|nr:hypothetical protein [Calditrichaceae bacterium]
MRQILFIIFTAGLLNAQLLIDRTYELAVPNDDIFSGYLYGNGIVDIVINNTMVWAGTGYGLNKTTSAGQYWENYDQENYLAKGGVSAIHYMDENTLWIATAFDTVAAETEMTAGGGLSYTRDAGATWTFVRQPVDPNSDTLGYSPTTTNISNITYDIASLDSTIWITSWAGGLRKSNDMGKTWEVVTIDGRPFRAANDNVIHLAFSALVENGNLWIGTAGGIGRSANNGESFEVFSHKAGEETISGNFVVALGYQPAANTIWAATIEANAESEYRAVSKTSNGGATWQVVLPGIFAHNFAFDGNIVYVAADEGLFKSEDGENWYTFPPIKDYDTGDEILRNEFYSVNIQNLTGGGSRLWAGSSDGLVYTDDNGFTWHVNRSYVRTSIRPEPKAYAYPSPFSPSRHSYARFEFDFENTQKVDIKIFDFAMDLVKKIQIDDLKPKWDGTNEAGDIVASGVYIYRVEVDGQLTWGKIAVIN